MVSCGRFSSFCHYALAYEVNIQALLQAVYPHHPAAAQTSHLCVVAHPFDGEACTVLHGQRFLSQMIHSRCNVIPPPRNIRIETPPADREPFYLGFDNAMNDMEEEVTHFACSRDQVPEHHEAFILIPPHPSLDRDFGANTRAYWLTASYHPTADPPLPAPVPVSSGQNRKPRSP